MKSLAGSYLSLYDRIGQFLRDAWPEDITVRPKVRVYRFMEEAMELGQALDVTKEQAQTLLDRVYGNPPGDVKQEVGGVVFTMFATVKSLGMDVLTEGHASVDEAYGRIDKIREKNKTKPRAW